MAVWTFGYMAPLQITRVLDEAVVRTGAGFSKTAIFSPSIVRADGTGSSSPYRGQNIFTVRVDVRDASATNDIIDFLQARVDSGRTSFQFYNVRERAVDSSGAAATGMYWVKFLGNMSQVIREAQLSDFVDLVFEEDLTAY